MLRSELIQGVKEVRNALIKSNFFELIGLVIRGETRGEKIDANVFQSFQEYIILAEKYNPAAKEIIKILGSIRISQTN